MIIDPRGTQHCYLFQLDYGKITNNRAEYEALIIELEMLIELGVDKGEVFGDFELVINPLNGDYKCTHITITNYYMIANQLLSFWGNDISINHIPRYESLVANEMAQVSSGVQVQ